jgi:hypothetical protein
VSSAELQEQAFWSVESRLVDSLGLIARDLGREFGVNEFLAKFASDSEHLSFSPMLPDAWQFASRIKQSHVPAVVEFSRRHQQAAIRWEPGDRNATLWNAISTAAPGVRRRWFQSVEAVGAGQYLSHWARNEELLAFDSVDDFSGDDEKVQGVVARTGLVFRKGSALEKLWRGMERAGIESLSAMDSDSGAVEVAMAVTSFAAMLRYRELRYGSSGVGTRGGSLWAEGFEALHTWMRGADAEVLPMREIDKQFDFSEIIFDPSSFWRDWNK